MQQYWAPAGMQSVLADLLKRAAPDAMDYNVKVECITRLSSSSNSNGSEVGEASPALKVEATVKCSPKQAALSDAAARRHHQPEGGQAVEAVFDTVVVAVPAPDCLYIRGLSAMLPTGVADLLAKIGYDSRWSVGVFYESNTVCSALRSWFAGAAELNLDGDCGGGGGQVGVDDDADRDGTGSTMGADGGWHLLARQLEAKQTNGSRKKKSTTTTTNVCTSDGSTCNSSSSRGGKSDDRSRCAVVGHTAATFSSTTPLQQVGFTREEVVPSLHNLVAAGANLPVDEVAAAAVGSTCWQAFKYMHFDCLLHCSPDYAFYFCVIPANIYIQLASSPDVHGMCAALLRLQSQSD